MAGRKPYRGSSGHRHGRVPYRGSTKQRTARTPYRGEPTSTKAATPPPKKEEHHGGLLHAVAKYSGAELAANLAKDVGHTAVGVGPGLYHTARALESDLANEVRHPGQAAQYSPFGAGRKSKFHKEVVKPTAKQYAETYGPLAHGDLGKFATGVYQHPLGPLLDAATVLDLGATAGVKLGALSGERAALVTRSPRAIATGKGPKHVDVSSTKPIVRGREVAANRLRANERFVSGRLGEVRRYGKQIQAQATQHALGHMNDYQPYLKATRHLSQKEWAALHIRAMDIHPDDLSAIWKGTPAEKWAADPQVRKLVLQPSKKLAAAEQATRGISAAGEKLSRANKMLREDTAQARPGLTKRQASEKLGRPVQQIHGDPYYVPHTLESMSKAPNPLAATGGGKGIPRKLGSQKQNLGVLALTGRMHLRGDILGPEFLRRVKKVKYDEIHNALVRGGIPISHQDILSLHGGTLPKGYEYIRTKPGQRIPATIRGEGETHVPIGAVSPRGASGSPVFQARVDQIRMSHPLDAPHHARNIAEIMAAMKRGVVHPITVDDMGKLVDGNQRLEAARRLGWEHIPAIRDVPPPQAGSGVALDKLIPNAEDLHDSALAEGFTTTDPAAARQVGGHYIIVPKQMVKAATGEFTRVGENTRRFVKKPLSVWRSLVLGLRPGFLTNNFVGNSMMYAAKTGGQGALRDLFMAIKETHGDGVAKQVLDNAATPPELRQSLYREFFPEQMHGTFGRTQSPAASKLTSAAGTAGRGFNAVTGAIPKVTSAVAETSYRKALIRHYIRHSPEFKKVYRQLPKQTRSFEDAARQIMEGKAGKAYQRNISKQVNNALGDYLNMSATERNVLRNLVPFYSWYRAITVTTFHLAADTPLRANILGQLGQIGRQWSDEKLGDVPSFLEGSIPLGEGKQGTRRVLATQGLNPYATLEQLRRGSTEDVTDLGLNPFLTAGLDAYAKKKYNGGISPPELVASTLQSMLLGLPPSRLIAPPSPSRLYPTRNRRTQELGYLGIPVKEYSRAEAARQKAQGR